MPLESSICTCSVDNYEIPFIPEPLKFSFSITRFQPKFNQVFPWNFHRFPQCTTEPGIWNECQESVSFVFPVIIIGVTMWRRKFLYSETNKDKSQTHGWRWGRRRLRNPLKTRSIRSRDSRMAHKWWATGRSKEKSGGKRLRNVVILDAGWNEAAGKRKALENHRVTEWLGLKGTLKII